MQLAELIITVAGRDMFVHTTDCISLGNTVLFQPTLQSLITGVPELKRFSELSHITTGFE